MGSTLGPCGLGSVGDLAEQGRQGSTARGRYPESRHCQSLSARRLLHACMPTPSSCCTGGTALAVASSSWRMEHALAQVLAAGGGCNTTRVPQSAMETRARSTVRVEIGDAGVTRRPGASFAQTGSKAGPECGMTLFLLASPRRRQVGRSKA